MITYTGITPYIESKESLRDKVCAIDNIIDALEMQALESVVDQGTASYSLDDGQVKISTNYRSMEDITKALTGLEAIRQRYLNRLNGHVKVLRGKLNRSRRYGY